MKSVLYAIRRPPGIAANETLDMILVSGVFDQPTKVLFMDEGVLQLIGDRSVVGEKDTAKKWSSLPVYEINEVFVDEPSLIAQGIARSELPDFVDVVTPAKTNELLHSTDYVVTD